MMQPIGRIVLLWGALFSLFARADLKAKVAAAAKGWEIMGAAEGDLNGDKISDIAVILAEKGKAGNDEGESSKALLRLYVADKKGKVTLATEAPKAVCLNCGGAKGAPVPFEMSIAKGVFSLTFSGGSRQMYDLTTKWRFQNGDYFLIGIHDVRADTLASDKDAVASVDRDVNVSTLKMVEKVDRVESASESGEVKTKATEKKCAAPEALKAMRLKDYSSEEFPVPKCSDAAV